MLVLRVLSTKVELEQCITQFVFLFPRCQLGTLDGALMSGVCCFTVMYCVLRISCLLFLQSRGCDRRRDQPLWKR